MDDQTPLYYIGILGDTLGALAAQIKGELTSRIEELGLEVGRDVMIFEGSPQGFTPHNDRCRAAICFPVASAQESALDKLIRQRVPLVPIASSADRLPSEFPGQLGALNGLFEDTHDATLIANALLESASLLRQNRRVFLSYRRKESTPVALQLYAELSARNYDVFLDTHRIPAGSNFQNVLWQRLCDSDVLVCLDTPGYFDSRWTDEEFARATIRGLAVLRVAWPETPSRAAQHVSKDIELSAADFEEGQTLGNHVVSEIARQVELLRTKSMAMRLSCLLSMVTSSFGFSDGKVEGYSLRKSLIVSIRGRKIAIYPELGVPTLEALYKATLDGHAAPTAVIYSSVGLQDSDWSQQMKWLEGHVGEQVRLICAHSAGWEFTSWR